mgnify:CR=1 FL=1
MKKRKAIITLIVFFALLAGMVYTAIYGLGASKSGSASDIKLGLDLAGGVSITYQVEGDKKPSATDMSDTIYKLQKRVDNYSTEAHVYQEGDNRIDIEIPGVTDANAVLEEMGKPGSLYFIRQTDADGNQNYVQNGGKYVLNNKTIDQLVKSGDAVLTGSDVSNAEAGYQNDSMNNQQIVVDLTFTASGAKKFADATTKAYKAGESIGIYYDGEFISVPRVQAAITDGKAVITGESTIDEAKNLASTIRIGGLKLELKELRSNVVGAQLGQNAIKSSLKAAVIGFAVLVVFMIAVYYIMGLAASLALVMYTALTVILINGFDITLTLPGIAGIILSIGMAVDANVIIFARIREELKSGKSLKSAEEVGFHKALSAIIDGNVTTLIAAAVLGATGTGSIKGFAQTLALGIFVSMFTALFVTRTIMNAFYNLGIQNLKLYGVGKDHKRIHFLEKSPIFITCSVTIISIGIIAMIVSKVKTGQPLNYNLEFLGGTSTTVTFDKDMSLDDINDDVVPLIEKITGDSNVQAQKVANSDQVIFKTRTLDLDERTQFVNEMKDKFGVDEKNITDESISSTISREMQKSAIIVVVITCFFILLYVWFRFKDIRFASGAVLALVHDVLVTVAFYAVFRLSVGSDFVACVLTIVGYSINDTIVVFDRIRENLASRQESQELIAVADESITETLSRSLFTSMTTIFMVLSLFIFGVPSIREFALPLMVGICCGTYSSIELASPIWYFMRHAKDVKIQKEKIAAKEAKKAKRSGGGKAAADK